MPASIYEHPVWVNCESAGMHPGGRYLTEQIFTGCQLSENARVLDLGCGSGNSLRLLAEKGMSVMGVDLSIQLLDYARHARASSEVAQASAEKLPFATASLDAVLCECTLSLFDLPAALQECKRVLKPAGWLLVSDLYVRNPLGLAALRALPGDSCVSRAFLQDGFEDQIAQSGFRILHWNDHSQALRTFPVCQLLEASQVDPFDLQIAAAKARLGYFSLLARKEA